MHDEPIEFAGNNEVAATPEYETPAARRQASEFGKLGACLNASVIRRAAGQGQGVTRRQVNAGLDKCRQVHGWQEEDKGGLDLKIWINHNEHDGRYETEHQ